MEEMRMHLFALTGFSQLEVWHIDCLFQLQLQLQLQLNWLNNWLTKVVQRDASASNRPIEDGGDADAPLTDWLTN